MFLPNSKKQKRAARIIRMLCGFLFAAFFFLYLFVMQADTLGMAQRVYSGGKMLYSPLVGAGVVTLVLLLLQWQLNRLLKLRGRFLALSYFPSCLLLTLLINFCARAYGESSGTYWGWVIGVGIFYLAFVLLIKAAKPLEDVSDDWRISSWIWPNAFFTALSFLFVGGCGNSNDAMHYTLETVAAIQQHDYEKALGVGKKSFAASRELSAFRAYALSRQGELGSRLFEYPQNFGSQGLLLPRKDSVRFVFPPDSVYRYLGAFPSENQTVMRYLELLLKTGKAKPAAGDYRLCALLLDKKLDDFVRELPNYYAVADTLADSIPTHYREALTIYMHTRAHPTLSYKNTIDDTNLSDFQKLANKYPAEVEKANFTRREFGKSYYWYWFFKK